MYPLKGHFSSSESSLFTVTTKATSSDSFTSSNEKGSAISIISLTAMVEILSAKNLSPFLYLKSPAFANPSAGEQLTSTPIFSGLRKRIANVISETFGSLSVLCVSNLMKIFLRSNP